MNKSGVFGSDIDRCVYQIEERGDHGSFELDEIKTECVAVFKMDIVEGDGQVKVTALFNFGAGIKNDNMFVYEYKIISTCNFHYAPKSKLIFEYLSHQKQILQNYLLDTNDAQKMWVYEQFAWWDFDPENIKEALKKYISKGLISPD